ncbi:hypothetical protein [Virgibacillus siamensis]|nr:hypothetical protein [Virgibacillus siamensis]
MFYKNKETGNVFGVTDKVTLKRVQNSMQYEEVEVPKKESEKPKSKKK